MKTTKFLVPALSLTLLFTSCKKDDTNQPGNPDATTGVFALSEGSFSTPGTTLTFYNSDTHSAVTDFYENANQSSLGTLGNDLLIYGSKMYIVMNVDSYVEIADATTAKHLSSVTLETAGGNLRQPRYVVPYKSNVLVSSWDGTVAVIDTASLQVTKFITAGSNPEQMAVAGDKLYVVNSGGLQTVMDSTVSVVDLISMTETSKIVVGLNPATITSDNDGSIFVGTLGNYVDIGPKLVRINTETNTVTKSADTAVGKMTYYDGLLYTIGGYLGSSHVRTLNPSDFSETSSNFVTDGTIVTTAYGITVDRQNGDVYVADAKNFTTGGEVFCFSNNGVKKFSFPTSPGTNPNTIALAK